MNVLEKILEEIDNMEMIYVNYRPGEQAHWCRDGILYPANYCEHFEKYTGSTVEDDDTCERWSNKQADWRKHMLHTFLAGH